MGYEWHGRGEELTRSVGQKVHVQWDLVSCVVSKCYGIGVGVVDACIVFLCVGEVLIGG